MMPAFTLRAARTTAVGAAVALALVAGLLTAPAQAEPVGGAAQPAVVIPDAPDCPGTLPTTAVAAGMKGQGLTVVRGATPQPFAVEVLGVLEDGIGAGRDMIIIEVSDLPGGKVISAGGGIWAGMSGSPVYIDGMLLGAVAYGFSAAPSPIGGVTPAADMLDLLGLSSAVARTKAASATERSTVSLSKEARRSIAARAEAAVPAGSLKPLTLPMSVSGLTSKRLKRFQAEADGAGLPVVAYGGSRRTAPAATAALTRPQAGGNFAAALSYGDLTTATVGTTTAVCGDEALAFGHPYQYIGAATYGANDASSLSIVKDDTFGSFKLANLTAPFGTVDQDRLAGLRADLTKSPALTPIKSTIRNLDNGKRRRGTTLAADTTSLPAITAFGLLANFDVTFDEIGDGRASTSWTITGRRRGDVPFTISRSNKFASRDISADAAFDVAFAVEALVGNEFEPVTIDRVSLLSSVATAYRQWTINQLEVSVNGGPYVSPRVLRVKAGATLKIRVRMRPYGSTAIQTSAFTMKVPANAAGRSGVLVATGGVDLASGGGEEEGCLLDPAACDEETESSLSALISDLASAPRNDEVVARLVLDPVTEDGKPLTRTATNRHAQTVAGQRSLSIEVT